MRRSYGDLRSAPPPLSEFALQMQRDAPEVFELWNRAIARGDESAWDEICDDLDEALLAEQAERN